VADRPARIDRKEPPMPSDDAQSASGAESQSDRTEAGRPASGPHGDVYDWYVRGQRLLEHGNPAAAATLLERASAAEPNSRSIRESLGRALYGAGRYAEAVEVFAELTEQDPADDYARFGWGRAALALGDMHIALEQLALATAMRPDNSGYAAALRSARHAQGIVR
jgi:predicted Zn-dependent protease